jgi:hypothetical protein
MKKEKKVTLKQVGYYIDGISYLKMWGGGKGEIEMYPFTVKTLSRNNIIKNINDAEFGVEAITGADINIYYLYEDGYKKFWKSQGITLKPNEHKIVQRGISWVNKGKVIEK